MRGCMRDYRISGHHLTAACGLRQRAFQGACKLPTSSEMLRHFGHLFHCVEVRGTPLPSTVIRVTVHPLEHIARGCGDGLSPNEQQCQKQAPQSRARGGCLLLLRLTMAIQPKPGGCLQRRWCAMTLIDTQTWATPIESAERTHARTHACAHRLPVSYTHLTLPTKRIV